MDSDSLVTEELEAGAEFVRRFNHYAPVKAAFWLKPTDERWYLYVASDQIGDTNRNLGYREVVRLWQEMQDPNFDMFRVKLIEGGHPLARAVLEVHHRYSGKKAIHYTGYSLGGESVDGAYLYPLPSPAVAGPIP